MNVYKDKKKMANQIYIWTGSSRVTKKVRAILERAGITPKEYREILKELYPEVVK